LAHPCRFGQLADFCKIQKVAHSKDSAAPGSFSPSFCRSIASISASTSDSVKTPS
jgi:hypothetical protein